MKILSFVLLAFVALERAHLVISFLTPQTAKNCVPSFNTVTVSRMAAENDLDKSYEDLYAEWYEDSYAEWIEKYNRPYDADRLEIFRSNCDQTKGREWFSNYKGPSSWHLTEYADCTFDMMIELLYAEWIKKYERPYDAGRYEVFRSNCRIKGADVGRYMYRNTGFLDEYVKELNKYSDCTPDKTVELAYTEWIEKYNRPYDAGRLEVFRSYCKTLAGDLNLCLLSPKELNGLSEYADCTPQVAAALAYAKWIEKYKDEGRYRVFLYNYQNWSIALRRYPFFRELSEYADRMPEEAVEYAYADWIKKYYPEQTPNSSAFKQYYNSSSNLPFPSLSDLDENFVKAFLFLSSPPPTCGFSDLATMGFKESVETSEEGLGNQPDVEKGAVDSVYAESTAQLSTSGLAYAFTDIIDLVRDGKLHLTIPAEFPEKDFGKLLVKSMNFTDYNEGNGISFFEMKKLIEENEEGVAQAYEQGLISSFGDEIYRDVLETDANYVKGLYLSFHRSLDQKVACVYSIIKDTKFKRIIVSFRGSVTKRDWKMNLRSGTIKMNTPEKIRHKLKGSLQEGVHVRTGFYQYLFNNTKMKEGKPQQYESIRKDIQTLLKDETDYTVYVTGHSLGGALAALFSFNLAGGGNSEDMLDTRSVPIPKPVTCVTWAAPFSGSRGFRSAYELLEREGLLRSLRINNDDDPVPTAPPLAYFVFGSRMAHVGINIRLSSSGFRIEHSSLANPLTALRNSMLKPIWRMRGERNPHSLQLHQDHFQENKKEFKAMRLDDLYKNNTIVSQDFIDGNIR